MPVTHLLYLHGFRSSPQSTKARQMAARMTAQHPAVTWCCPHLPPSPREAMALLMDSTANWPAERMAVIGSSLGGFYATAVAQARSCKAVLLNPAADPARDLAKYVGEQTAWHDPSEHFYFSLRYVEELRELARGMQGSTSATPGPCFAVIAKGDEVLDWREMTAMVEAHYPNARIKLLPGSDHALSDFDAHIDEVFEFLHLPQKVG